MVQLFEKYRISYASKHQFLGDMFEQLLNKGFKQNEGQFFTPMPITRFIWDSLPIQKILQHKGGSYPKVIDYACGSGHFLTEAVEAINAARPTENNDWAKESIYGVEKDYRLARVSQVSMFMNGAGNANIIFGDGLDNNKGIQNETFDILVANPPYSVAAFKSHLKLKNNQLSLLDSISNNGGEIEVLFCERIAQLLVSDGVAAVILPSSILSNDSSSYTAARKLLLNEFRFRAIIQLGSKTFGATGTNTVILFLEKTPYPPKQISLAKDTATTIFTNASIKQKYDQDILTAYLTYIDVPADQYEKLRNKTITWEEIQEEKINKYIVTYRTALLDTLELSKTEQKENPTNEQQQKLKMRKFLDKFISIEQEKIALFALLYQQKTLIITAPSDNAQQKAFLGYDWSNRKGAEGIQILQAGGKLYNPENRFADNTLAACVRYMFNDQMFNITPEQAEYAKILDTLDMLDFNRVYLNYALKTSAQKKIEIVSKYPLVSIAEITITIESGKRPSGGVGQYNEGAYSLGGEHIGKDNGRLELNTIKYVPISFFNAAKKGIIQKHDILLCKDGALTGKVAIVRDELDGIMAMINEHLFILRCQELTTQKYLFNYLYSEMGQALLKDNITGSAQGGLNSTNLKNIKIPLPPQGIQQQIIAECGKIDEEYENSRMKIEEYRAKIAQIFNDLEVVRGGGKTI
ncbi:N-6 DNA methylase [Gallibacterium melopsittaci]